MQTPQQPKLSPAEQKLVQQIQQQRLVVPELIRKLMTSAFLIY